MDDAERTIGEAHEALESAICAAADDKPKFISEMQAKAAVKAHAAIDRAIKKVRRETHNKTGDRWRPLLKHLNWHNGGILCDMLIGTCACGAWHTVEELPERARREENEACAKIALSYGWCAKQIRARIFKEET